MGAFEARDWARAEAEARERLATTGADADRVHLIEALAARGQFDSAVSEHAAIIAPTPRSLATLAQCLFGLEQRDAAVAALAKCLESTKDDPEDWLAAARVFELIGRPGEALACAQRAVVLAPDSPANLTMLGLCLLGVDDEVARRRLEASARLDGRQPRVWLALFQLDARRGAWDSAKVHAGRALEVAPNWTDAQAAFHQASLKTRSLSSFLVLVPLVASCAVALSAFPMIGQQGFWPRLAVSITLGASGLYLDVISRRRRARRLAAEGTIAATQEVRFGVGSAAAEKLAPSQLPVGRLVVTVLNGCAWFFAPIPLVLVWLVVRYTPADRLHFHPAMLVMLVPWGLTGLLWWEARLMQKRVEQAERDRS